MPNFKITSRSAVVAWVAVALALTAALVVYLNRPVRRVSLPKGATFPACLLDPPFKTCDESGTCVGDAPGRLTYAKSSQPHQGEEHNWCCPDGTRCEDINHVMT